MVKVGLGVIIKNSDGDILIGKRISDHAPYYSIPGGKLDIGETFEEGAKREILEETGLILNTIKVIGLTNNLKTYIENKKHFISVVLFSDNFTGTPQLMEPNKCEGWSWVNPKNIPKPVTDFCDMSINNYLNQEFYKEYF